MKKILLLIPFLFTIPCVAEESNPPDTVSTGFYITSIHNIDFQQREYNINMWLWFKYKNRDFDFTKNLEIPQAKTFSTSYTTIDTLEDGRIYLLMKLECLMKDSWKIDKFPFDRQVLRLGFENSQFDSSALVFSADTLGEHYGRFAISGWEIEKDSLKIAVKNQIYKTAFGDESALIPYSAYSALKLKIGIQRKATWTLFWKMFLGMYVAFFIAYVCFFIDGSNIEARFGLTVGALFAAVGNKYVVDSSLPDSTTTTLVDTLHALTLIAIFVVIVSTIYVLKLVKNEQLVEAKQFDKRMAWAFLLTYLLLNAYFVFQANAG